jgi:hypothetical protein
MSSGLELDTLLQVESAPQGFEINNCKVDALVHKLVAMGKSPQGDLKLGLRDISIRHRATLQQVSIWIVTPTAVEGSALRSLVCINL